VSTLQFVLTIIAVWLVADIAAVGLLMMLKSVRRQARHSRTTATFEFERKYQEDKAEMFSFGHGHAPTAAHGG
jgi:hypothetical protein